jgi:murein DD-endopeptidase MepM/ murein hydrolase activator NlpD
MIMRYFLIAYFSLLISHSAVAQYSQGYFRNPLGIPMRLVANFGEIRSDHFHMGFDLRTQQQENLPVYAAAEGYISRVVIEPGGYGKAVYITHPGGYTTLYAHLNDFFPALHRFVETRQYNEEKWEQDLTFNKSQFPVSKGQFIAYSGNTGASQGPHLHFEIRDSRTGKNVNPRLFHFPIADDIPPFIYKLFLYDRNYSTYSIDPAEIKVKGGKGNYFTRDTLIETGSAKISFGISAEDVVNASSFRFGIYSAELWVDSIRQISFSLDEMNYEDSRYMNASIDYKKRITDGSLIQHLSRLPGNKLSIFDSISDGIVSLQDTIPHNIMIVAKDIAGNESVVSFKLKWNPTKNEQRFFTQETEKMLPGKENRFERDNIRIDFPATAFYDTVPFFYAEATSEHIKMPLHQLHYHYVPVHDPYTVSVKYDQEIDRSKAIWKLVSGKDIFTSKVEYRDGRYIGFFDRLGMLSLIEDTTAPLIAASGWRDDAVFAKSGSVSFRVRDEESYVEVFRAELDDKWIMFSRKGNVFTYKFDEHCEPGKHELKVMLKDTAGNETVRTFNFELREKLPVKKKSTKTKRR